MGSGELRSDSSRWVLSSPRGPTLTERRAFSGVSLPVLKSRVSEWDRMSTPLAPGLYPTLSAPVTTTTEPERQGSFVSRRTGPPKLRTSLEVPEVHVVRVWGREGATGPLTWKSLPFPADGPVPVLPNRPRWVGSRRSPERPVLLPLRTRFISGAYSGSQGYRAGVGVLLRVEIPVDNGDVPSTSFFRDQGTKRPLPKGLTSPPSLHSGVPRTHVTLGRLPEW